MSSQSYDSGGGGPPSVTQQQSALQTQSSSQSSSSATVMPPFSSTYQQPVLSIQTPPSQTSVNFMDDLVKEYLLFRGFQSTLKSLEHELKSDKSNAAAFRADKCTDLILSYIHAYDLTALLDFWSYLDHKFFSRLSLKATGPSASSLSRKYELFILRYYLVYAVQTSRNDKAIELLEQCANKLQAQPEWRDWYMLPFLKNPEDNPIFSIYFSRNWIDTFIISLQNFLNVVFQSLPFPRLLNYDEDAFWNKQRIHSSNQLNSFASFEQEYLQSELIDEFQLIQTDSQNRQGSNTLISMIKNLTTSTSKTKTTSQTTPQKPQVPQNTSQSNLVNPVTTSSSGTNLSKSSKTDVTKAKRSLEKILDNSEQQQSDEVSMTSQISGENLNSKPPIMFDLNALPSELLQPLPDLTLEEPKLIEQAMSGIKQVEHYLNMSSEDYLQHKSPILHCRFSIDGKYVASVDSQGYIKIWSVENPLNTINTLMQKSSVLSIEWDVRNYNILYIGTRSHCVKVYDVQQKKIMQELTINKVFPLTTLVRSFSNTTKILIFTASKLLSRRDGSVFRNSQLVVGEFKNKSGLNIEKTIDFEGYFCQSCVGLEASDLPVVVFGCSDGFVRFFNIAATALIFAERLHQNSVVNLVMRKNQTLISLSNESIKLSRVNIVNASRVELETTNTIAITNNCIERLNINAPFHTLDTLIGSAISHTSSSSSALSSLLQSSSSSANNGGGDPAELRDMLNASRLIAVDSIEKALFSLDKSGVYVGDLSAALESSEGANGAQLFGLPQSTTFDVWNSNHLSILLIGSLNGTIRFFRLLHQF